MFVVRQFEARTLSWWSDQRAEIDFEPSYQRRGGLWSRRDKAFLIDSIINGFDIPKLYLADFTTGPADLNESSRQFAVIDGKQRFEAIFNFIDGQITLDPSFVLDADPKLTLGGLSYADLASSFPKVARLFDNYNLTVMTVATDEEGKINELFVRLNRNKTLTGAEIRNAMRGIVPELIRDLASQKFFKSRIAFETKRAQDLDIAAKFLLVEFLERLTDTKRRTLDAFVDEGLESDARPGEFKRAASRVKAVMRQMNDVFTPNDKLLRSQGPMVPYYWLVRNTAPEYQGEIRSFLVMFEEERARNRALAKNPVTARRQDPELSAYDRFNRSINDQVSIEGRFDILERRFDDFEVAAAA
jgi:hypothetical protein